MFTFLLHLSNESKCFFLYKFKNIFLCFLTWELRKTNVIGDKFLFKFLFTFFSFLLFISRTIHMSFGIFRLETMSWESNGVNVEVDWKPERTLVLLGRTGNGKSATGNSILGETKFLSKTRGRFITKECKLHTSMQPNGQRINVIDTPGEFL